MARELLGRERLVVAAGGGAFARADDAELLKHNAVTVWLRCDLDNDVRRVPADGRRPLAGNREIMTIRLAEREPSYREADVHRRRVRRGARRGGRSRRARRAAAPGVGDAPLR